MRLAISSHTISQEHEIIQFILKPILKISYSFYRRSSGDLCDDGLAGFAHLVHWQQPVTCHVTVAQRHQQDRTQAALFQAKDCIHGGGVEPFHWRAVDFLFGCGNQCDTQRDIGLAGGMGIVFLGLAGQIVGF